jgi:hypothetical protein
VTELLKSVNRLCSKFPKITWKQAGGLPECPYFYRYIINFGPFAIRLHNWLGDDDHRAYHDHPYWFLTIVLKGGYTDVSPKKETWEYPLDTPIEVVHKDILRIGSIRFRPAEFKHSVQDVIPGTWTLLISGKPSRRWGFWVGGKLIKRDKYFAVYGHHPCDPEDSGIRMKPGGERI